MTPVQRPGAIAIVAALPRELAPLARDLNASRILDFGGVLLHTGSLKEGAPPFLLVTAGMGRERVSLAVAAAMEHGPIAMLLSVGLAGACDPVLQPGSLVEASLVVDTRSGERFETSPRLGIAAPGVLATAVSIAGTDEKQRLHAAYNASAVDMEAATIARIARAHGIRFAALKAISDEHDVDLTALSAFTGPHGSFRTGAFALHTLLRPRQWRATARLGRNSSSALESLTSALHQVLVTAAAAPTTSSKLSS
ncbi:MAG: phosphorylase [Acidobacteriaceae bacterium]